MKKSTINLHIVLVLSILFILAIFDGCKKTENPIKFPKGIFPDTVINLSDINSSYDDYNLNLQYILPGSSSIVFSSNRESSGGQFDLVQGQIDFNF